ncbi:hypothetical protein YC2023_067931 [Brassica napus]
MEEHWGYIACYNFFETVKEACTELFPNVLCKYLYNLSEHFNKFYLMVHIYRVSLSPRESTCLRSLILRQ